MLLIPIAPSELKKPKEETLKGPAFAFANALVHAGELVTAAVGWLKENKNPDDNNKPTDA